MLLKLPYMKNDAHEVVQ